MPPRTPSFLVTILLLFALACDDDSPVVASSAPEVTVLDEMRGSNCVNGGVRIDTTGTDVGRFC